MKKESSSWDPYSSWYDKIVGEKGHFFHRETILPCLKKILHFTSNSSLLDLGCGQGFLAGEIPKGIDYLGVDIGKNLIALAKKHHPQRNFLEHDLTKELKINRSFTHAIFVLSLQNIPDMEMAISNAAKHLSKDGQLILVLNHPCFRIPRQTQTVLDEKNASLYRRVNVYHSKMEIPIQMHPSKEDPSTTLSFHHPLEDYFSALKNSSLVVEELQELYSTKTSVGKHAKMENRARNEFPYFLVIAARKVL